MPSQTTRPKVDRHLAKAARAHRRIRGQLRSFVKFRPPHRPYWWAPHTRALCDALQRASDMVLAGGRCYMVVVMPPRHGKSDLASRRFPAWHLLRAPDHEVILTGYSAELVADMSVQARRTFREVAPMYGLDLAESRQKIAAWQTTKNGTLYAVGLGGTITGRGAHVLVVDDYLKSREEAESRVARDRVWDSFRNDLMTRLAPECAVVIPCTRWHEDDLVGRIFRAMADDPNFPRFELIRFPAQAENGSWLFPERFDAAYYEGQRAALGSYFWQACYQGDPRPRRGNFLRVDMARLVDRADVPWGELRLARGWDLASTAKERASDDPDYTVGLLVGMRDGELWIADVQRGRWTAGERDERMTGVAQVDGSRVRVGIESVAGYKDTFERVRQLLMGRCHVEAVTPDRDLVARLSPVEPFFEAGRVNVVRASWTDDLLAELRAFPSGRHDDQAAALAVAHRILSRPTAGVVRL